MDARELRHLAEAADGQRKRVLALVWNDVDRSYVLEELGSSSNEVVLQLFTPFVVDDRRRIAEMVQVKNLGGEVFPLPKDVDAIFWSEAAVEKFVIPYYARVLGVDGVRALWDAFRDPTIIAIIHYEPTRYAFRNGMESAHLLRERPGMVTPFEIISLAEWIAERR
jgi:hypothetical protein